jgi:hypothetical protein
MDRCIVPIFYALDDAERFERGVNDILGGVNPAGSFAGDNLITWGRNLGFLGDDRFRDAVRRHCTQRTEQAAIWRLHVLCWAAHQALRLDGDLVECGTYRGTSARVVADYVDLAQTGKAYWLYDAFDHSAEMPHHRLAEHGPDLEAAVRTRFADLPGVRVVAGLIPASFERGLPERVCFLHLDLNNAPAELAALDALWDRITPGGVIVLDDFGWRAYRDQHEAETAWFRTRGVSVLELPTGQGLVIRP